MQRLEKEGILENTLIVFFTDHGISHARGKQFLYDEGTHIPLIIRGPGIPKGQKRNDLVEHIDVAALSLAAAGIEIPEGMEGVDVLSSDHQPKQAVFAARDRCGEATDRIRSVRTDRFLYVKNFYPHRPHLMPSNYKDSKIIIQRLRQLHSEKKLNGLSEKLLFSPTRPEEELYLYRKDGWQTENLAQDPKHAKVLKDMRKRLSEWMEKPGIPAPRLRKSIDWKPKTKCNPTETQLPENSIGRTASFTGVGPPAGNRKVFLTPFSISLPGRSIFKLIGCSFFAG